MSADPPNLDLISSFKDGSDLLRLVNDFSVRISTIPRPLALKVRGLRSSLRQVFERISNLKRVIHAQYVTRQATDSSRG